MFNTLFERKYIIYISFAKNTFNYIFHFHFSHFFEKIYS